VVGRFDPSEEHLSCQNRSGKPESRNDFSEKELRR
jgi:hypothetical protein